MNITRSMHLDFHTLPNIDDFGRDMDYDCIARTLADAGVQYVNSVATCNIGFAYFPTKVGKPYPYMKNDHFGELLKAYRKYGIGVSAYLNIGLNHQHCYENKSWCRVDDKGRIIHGDTTGNFFRSVCYNSDGYRNYLLSIVKEINDNYDVDGFFFDCIKIIPCYCEKCLAEMKTEGVNIKNRREVKKFTYGKILKLCKELKEIISDKEVFFCGLPFNSGLSTHLVVECLPSGNWGYDYFHQASAYARGFYKRPLYMTGRFQADWGDFGGVKNKASFEYDLYDALSNNCDICFGDHLHPRYGLNPAVTDTVKAVYTQAKFYERYTKNTEYLAEIAVLNPSDIFELERPSNVGVVRMLNELKYSYDFIDINADFKKYKLIILPDDIKVDSVLKKKLSKYLKSGGKILSTGTSGLNVKGNSFALEEYAFIRFSGFDKNNVPYFVFCEDKDRVEWSCYGSSILMILAKCCHDMDLFVWLLGSKCKKVSSFGSLSYFKKENAPNGAPLCCMDGCPVFNECPYNCVKIYVEDLGKQASVVRKVVSNDTSTEAILEKLKTGPYGRCVFHCDNDVVDHQVVNLEFENGVTVNFTMSAFTTITEREINIMGTHGQIKGNFETSTITVEEFATWNKTVHHVTTPNSGHGGSDTGIMRSFTNLVRMDGKAEGATGADMSVESHLIALAAEESRVSGKTIYMEDFYNN